MSSTDNPRMNITRDLIDFIVYGAPNSIGFFLVHRQIFQMLLVDPKEYGISNQAIDEKGEYYRFFTSILLHNDRRHFIGNTITFVPPCHRINEYLVHSHCRSKLQSVGLFWSFYVMAGVMANVGQYLIVKSWKYWLLFYFRNDAAIRESIDQRYDGMNWIGTEAVGASGAIFGMIGFNFCISLQLIMDRMSSIWNLLNEDGTERMDKENESEYDSDHCNETMMRVKMRYHAIKMCMDLMWLFGDGVHIYNGCLHRVYLDWQWRKQKRAGRDYMTPDGGMIGDFTHLCGLVSGMTLYGIYRLFRSKV